MEKKKLNIKEIGLEKIIIIFLTGVFLIIISFPNLFSGEKNSDKSNNQSSSSALLNTNTSTNIEDDILSLYTNKLEEKFQTVLKKVEGIGNVKVMITLKSSKELITLKDAPYTQDTMNETDGTGGSRVSSNINKNEESVLVTTGDGENTPYVIKEIEPEVEGVVIIAEGGGNPSIAGEIIDAVEVLFDVPTHKIKVMKMNSK